MQRDEERRQRESEELQAKQRDYERLRQAQEDAAKAERLREELNIRRRQQAAAFEITGPEHTARLALRLPGGQQVVRRFRPTAKLCDVYYWAECCAFLQKTRTESWKCHQNLNLKRVIHLVSYAR